MFVCKGRQVEICRCDTGRSSRSTVRERSILWPPNWTGTVHFPVTPSLHRNPAHVRDHQHTVGSVGATMWSCKTFQSGSRNGERHLTSMRSSTGSAASNSFVLMNCHGAKQVSPSQVTESRSWGWPLVIGDPNGSSSATRPLAAILSLPPMYRRIRCSAPCTEKAPGSQNLSRPRLRR